MIPVDRCAEDCIEQWVLLLQACKFQVLYIPGKVHIADSLSSCLKMISVSTSSSDLAGEVEEHIMCFVAIGATLNTVTTREVERAASEDEEMEEVQQCSETGRWQN